ncbi:hypothetical protein NDU88_005502 [Pleurodeles waltl]|uniref:Uncharacterized protein n=1 Tax=Pleurodeles waltl TaxID=8319 RepID=A0AAV7MWJ1_PLEWA|nr:hypothetical protein NDU88_005502 [Pleurodeles waltl]
MVTNGSRSCLVLVPSSIDSAQSNPCDNAALERGTIGTADEEQGMQDNPDNLCNQLKLRTSRVLDNGDLQEGDIGLKQLYPLYPLFGGGAGRGTKGTKEIFTGPQPYSHTSVPVEDNLSPSAQHGSDIRTIREAHSASPSMSSESHVETRTSQQGQERQQADSQCRRSRRSMLKEEAVLIRNPCFFKY